MTYISAFGVEHTDSISKKSIPLSFPKKAVSTPAAPGSAASTGVIGDTAQGMMAPKKKPKGFDANKFGAKDMATNWAKKNPGKTAAISTTAAGGTAATGGYYAGRNR